MGTSAPIPGSGCLRTGPERPAQTEKPAPRPFESDQGGAVLACVRCLQPITTTDTRTVVGGRHEHTCVNPHGFSFRIGCFARAAGCATVGEPSTFWSWFPGYGWQIERCAACREHLGWLFRSPDHVFHGLILDRLVEIDDASRAD